MWEVLRVGHEAKDLGPICLDRDGLRVGSHKPSPLLPGGSSPSVVRVLTASRSSFQRCTALANRKPRLSRVARMILVRYGTNIVPYGTILPQAPFPLVHAASAERHLRICHI